MINRLKVKLGVFLRKAVVCLVVVTMLGSVFSFKQQVFAAENQDLEVYMINVGGGSCTLVEFGGSYALIDTGGDYAQLQKILKAKKIKELQYVIITHNHSDHMGALTELLNSNIIIDKLYMQWGTKSEGKWIGSANAEETYYGVIGTKKMQYTNENGNVISLKNPSEWLSFANKRANAVYFYGSEKRVTELRLRSSVDNDYVALKLIHPGKVYKSNEKGRDINNTSGMVAFRKYAHKFLIGGDIMCDAMKDIMERAKKDSEFKKILNCDYYNISHHGRRDNFGSGDYAITEKEFLEDYVSPSYSFFTISQDDIPSGTKKLNDYLSGRTYFTAFNNDAICINVVSDGNGTVNKTIHRIVISGVNLSKKKIIHPVW